MVAPTSEQLDEIWQDDLLGRRADGQFLIEFLSKRATDRAVAKVPGSYVLNIDAAWGLGKTFFLDRMRKQLQASGYVAARVDAWRDDHAADPLLPVIGAIEKAISEAMPARAKRAAAVTSGVEELVKGGGRLAVAFGKGLVGQAVRRYAGEEFAQQASSLFHDKDDKAGSLERVEAAEQVIQQAAGRAIDKAEQMIGELATRAVGDFEKAQALIDSFRKQLSGVVEKFPDLGLEKPLFVLIDELDRCRPNYAIELLERIKHLFDVPNVVFVVATDTGQFRSSIKAIYGQDFSSTKYLNRFFDRTFEFEQLEPTLYMGFLLESQPLGEEKFRAPMRMSVEDYMSQAVLRFDLDLRAIDQTYDTLRSLGTVWTAKIPIELAVMYPLIVAYYLKLPLNGEVIAALYKSVPYSGTEVGASYYVDRYEDRPVKPRLATHRDMASALWEKVQSDIPSVMERDRERDGAGGWAYDVLRQEMNVLHNGQWNDRARPFSIVTKYPAMIRSAGRLTPTNGV